MAIRFMVPLLTIIFFFIIDCSYGKPAENENLLGLVVVNPESGAPDSAEVLNDAVRVQRSPQYELLNYDDFRDYSDSDLEGRHLHKHKHKKPHRPHGGFGCRRKHGCGGWQGSYYPEYGGHYPAHQQFGQGGSFATASAGSLGGGHYGGGNNQANAQSASFNFGPFSFSVAQAGTGQGSQEFF